MKITLSESYSGVLRHAIYALEKTKTESPSHINNMTDGLKCLSNELVDLQKEKGL